MTPLDQPKPLRSTFEVTFRCRVPVGATHVLAPGGLTTPEATCTDLTVEGGTAEAVAEATTGQTALAVLPVSGTITLTWRFDETPGAYPEGVFAAHPSRHTRAADALLAEVAAIAPDLTGLPRATAIARATAERFTYGHPAARFTDGLDAVPALGCGLTEGSCVDINTYFLAALRAAEIEAGYVTGFFFPEEKHGTCVDGHCWVLTRIGGAIHAWDIAHHLKMGTRDVRPALNPKPGFRAACAFGMGLAFPALGLPDVKALTQPVILRGTEVLRAEAPEIRLRGRAATDRAEARA
jgi:hypothetical protein